MSIKQRLAGVSTLVEASVLKAAMALPEPVQARLAGKPVVLDGQTLAPETQLALTMQRLARLPGAETMPIPEGREAVLHHSALAGGHQPIGAVRDLPVAGLPGRLYTGSSAGATSPLLLFLHGGGFMYGDLDSHDAPCRVLAERAGIRVLAVDYRMGPEDPFPAAYDDALAAFEWVVANAASIGADPDRLAVGGDSAGGNLAAGVAIEAARRGLPLAFQLLVYPMTDAEHPTRSYELFQEGFYLSKAFMDLANECYVPPGHDLRDPRLSPIHADLPAGLAPAYVVTAGFDPLRDEGEAYARKLADAGVEVELQRFPDQIHSFFNIVGVGRRSPAAVAVIAVKTGAALRR
ncbi:alpha/beta hydrolase [Nocardioides psychrotolerans]|uniref:Acetyl esterase n=1 Tax=Nocardioides psychrotolerans TaxID=1005945 RepID=A0A1I3N9B6_9ACTN|nr:alpha/beta hydrolase [Nocardioides psychrotolerans]GEP39817.1 alpha/beta hydrolase [Nocardioides psychrotolerans]SFJ05893.1 acetyl esterase [Nocardioides psychrotolerans]